MNFFIDIGALVISRPSTVVLLTEDGFLLAFDDQFVVIEVEAA